MRICGGSRRRDGQGDSAVGSMGTVSEKCPGRSAIERPVPAIRRVGVEWVSVSRVDNRRGVRIYRYVRPGTAAVQRRRGGDVRPGNAAVSGLINARVGAANAVFRVIVA